MVVDLKQKVSTILFWFCLLLFSSLAKNRVSAMKAAIAVGWKALAESSLKHSDIHLPTTTWYCVRYKGAADSAVCIYRNCFLIFTILVLFFRPTQRGPLSHSRIFFYVEVHERTSATWKYTRKKHRRRLYLCQHPSGQASNRVRVLVCLHESARKSTDAWKNMP